MKQITYALILVIFVACSESNEDSTPSTSNNTVDSDTSVVIIGTDTLDEEAFEENESDSFNLAKELYLKHFRRETVDSVFIWSEEGSRLKNDGQFLPWLNNGMKIRQSISRQFTHNQDAYEFVTMFEPYDQFISPLFMACVAECTENEFQFDIEKLKPIAVNTTGSVDDEFITLWLQSENYGYATEWGFKNWFGQTWDYGGSTLAGDSSIYNFLRRYDAFITEHGNDYSKYLNPLRRNALEMLGTFKSYMYSVDRIQREIKEVVDQVTLSPEERAKLLRRYEELNDPDANEIEVNCETGNCAYG